MGPHHLSRDLTGYIAALRALVAGGAPTEKVVRSVTAQLLARRGVTVPERFAGPATAEPDVPMAPQHLCSPWLPGHVHEALLDADTRKRAGAHYTPPAVARGLVGFAREGHGVLAPTVCDPAVGGGAFLLAAAETIAADGFERVEIARRHCFGCDVDPLAVDVARAALALFAGEWIPELDDHVTVHDALDATAPWSTMFDLVVGNPPFQNQLGRRTARDRVAAARLRSSFGSAAKGYVDTAALFLLRAVDLTRPGGRVALVQPQSTLTARDAAAVRIDVEHRSEITGVWFAPRPVFAASVRVWAPVLTVGEPAPHPAKVERRTGVAFEVAAPAGPVARGEHRAWSDLVVDLAGIPVPKLRWAGVVGDVATATAGFRQQFYGLVGAVRETTANADDAVGKDRDPPRLATTGLIDVLDLTWGRREARFAGRQWQRPVVDTRLLAPDVARWLQAQLVPKLVVATQTKVLEVAVDVQGDLVPCTPVIAVHAEHDLLWGLAAALSAPPLSALAMRTSFGSALSATAIKLSARQVLDLPLPADHDAWDDATRCARDVADATGSVRAEALRRFAIAASAAYGVHDEDLLSWWLERAD